MSYPLLIQITNVNFYNQKIQFKVCKADKSQQLMEGDLNFLQQCINQIASYRILGDRVEEFASQAVALEKQIIDTQRNIQYTQQQLSQLQYEREIKLQEVNRRLPAMITQSSQELQSIKAKNQIPAYDEKVIKAISTKTKNTILLSSLVGVSLGLYLMLTNPNNDQKIIGGVLGGLSGLAALKFALVKAEKSEDKFKHLALKTEAQRSKQLIEDAENRSSALIKATQAEVHQIKNLLNQQEDKIKADLKYDTQLLRQLQEEYTDKVECYQICKFYEDFRKQRGDQIVFGEEEQINDLNTLINAIQITNQLSDAEVAAAAGVAAGVAVGVGVLGLAAYGLFKLFEE